jgi:hypothetical protein
MSQSTRSHLFIAYNAAKALPIERGRLDRGLGIAQRRDTTNPYGCTAMQSLCPDGRFRGVVCKHRAAALLLDVAESL